MPQLPDFTAFGNAPSGLSGRASVDYTGAVAPGRQNIETASRSGAGLVAVGRGMEQAGEVSVRQLAREQLRQDHAALAEAKTTGLLNKTNLDLSLKDETDPNRILSVYPDAYKKAFETSGSQLSPEARQEYDLWATEQTQHGFVLANNYAHNIQMRQGAARFHSDMDGLLKASVGAELKDAPTYIGQAKQRVDAAIERGYIDPDTGFKYLENWSNGFRVGKIKSLPPDERLAILGGAKPGTIAANGLSDTDKGILNAIAGPESAGKYNVRYNGPNAATFDDFSRHPGVKVRIEDGPNKGKTSDAAGRYQFLGSTWEGVSRDLGLTDFSPETQDKGAIYFVKKSYKQKTGRDLDEDIRQNGGLTEGMLDVLSTAKGGPWEGFNTKAGRAKALAAYKATVSGRPEVGHAFEVADHPLVTDLPVEARDRLAADAARDWAYENHERVQRVEKSKALLNQRMADDRESILRTGQPLQDLSLDEVGQLYGNERVKQIEADRDAQKTFYVQTHDFDALPSAELVTRLDALRPSDADAGKAGFKERANLYKMAEADVKARIKERSFDPAAAVDRLPDVRELKSKVELGGDENAQRELVRARMRGFDLLKIPAERRVPVTREEAKTMAAPIMEALPGREREALAPIVTKINNIYGDEMTEKVLGYVLETAKIDQDTSQSAAKVFKQLGLGRQPSRADMENVTTTRTTSAMGAAAQGAPSTPAKTFPIPSGNDIRTLANNPTPQMVAMFNKHYGPGSGERIMGELAKTLPTAKTESGNQ